MHLCTDTVDLCFTIRFPTFDPINQTLYFFIVIPPRFQIIVVDEEFQISRITTIFCKIFAGKLDWNTSIIIAQEVLPVEVLSPYSIIVRIGSWLKSIITITIITTSRNRFIHNIPCSYRASAGFHHAFYPTFKLVGEYFFLFFRS